MKTTNRTSVFSNQKSPVRRFLRNENGQGIIFAAATLLILVGFVTFVFNIGRLLEGRTKVQLGADAAAYSGAVVQANSLSAIAWINSVMSQVYYNTLKTAADVNVAAVAAELERRMNPTAQSPTGEIDPNKPGYQAYLAAYNAAGGNPNSVTTLPALKQAMLDLSRIENSIAILTPRLVEEEMYAVAGRSSGRNVFEATYVAPNHPPQPRMSVYPSSRMFPSADSLDSWRIERLDAGWRITHLTGNDNSMLALWLDGQGWHLQYSTGGIVTQEVLITQDNPTRWHIQYFQPPGHLIQEIYLEQDASLGWVVWGTQPNPNGGAPNPTPTISFKPVDMDGDGYNEGVLVTQGSFSQVLRHGTDGNMYSWNSATKSYTQLTSNQTTIGGVNVQVNVTNLIHFPGATARIGDPTVVDIGGAHIVLTNPPRISCGLGPVRINVWGFQPDSFNVSVGPFSLTPGDSDGRWRNYFNPAEQIWWRQRLVVMGLDAAAKPNNWQYDRETLGAMLRYEPAWLGLLKRHAFMGRGFGSDPNTWPADARCAWTAWFNTDPDVTAPFHLKKGVNYHDHAAYFTQVPRAPGFYYEVNQAALKADPSFATAYYQTQYICPVCKGVGGSSVGGQWQVCPTCKGEDYDGDGQTDVRVYLEDLAGSPLWNNGAPGSGYRHAANGAPWPADNDYLDARIFSNGYTLQNPLMPLILSEDYFKWGLNIGVWKSPDSPVWFPQGRQPAWGTAAVASARVGFPADPGDPLAQGGYIYQFPDKGSRSNWCASLRNLYYANVQPKLYPTKVQVCDYDLDNDLLTDTPVTPIDESGLSFLWDAMLSSHQTSYNNWNNWLDRYNGQSDPRVSAVLNNMQDRQGRKFDYGSAGMNQVVEH